MWLGISFSFSFGFRGNGNEIPYRVLWPRGPVVPCQSRVPWMKNTKHEIGKSCVIRNSNSKP